MLRQALAKLNKLELNAPGSAGRIARDASRFAGQIGRHASAFAGRLGRHAPGLAGRLALITGVVVAFAVAAMYVYGVRSLRELAADEAMTRVQLGVAAAREGLRQTTEDVFTAAQILAERPPLQRLLRGSPAALQPYLLRSCESVALHACALQRGTELLATSTSEVDWARVLEARGEQGERFLVTGATEATAVAGATARVVENEDVAIVALRRMDAALAQRLRERSGVPINIVDYESFQPGEGPLGVLNSDALSRGGAVTGYVEALDSYVAVLPVATASGETVALLQALLPAREIEDRVVSSELRMMLQALVIAALAAGGSVLIARYWTKAVEQLTDAARRLAAGDLTASFPTGGGKELALLGGTMEEMRRNLVSLTTELRRREGQAQAVLSGIVEGVYAVDEDRRIRFLNSQAERLLSISSAEAAGLFCGDVLKPARDAQGRRPCEYACPIIAARRAGTGRAVEQLVPSPDSGERRVVIASAAPAEDGGLQVQVLRDETELEAARRTRDSVLANISHEFRTPLAAQLASIELLRDGIGTMGEQGQRELVASLQRGTQRLAWLIDNLLESVRIEAGQLGIRNQEVVFDDVVVAARELIEPLIEQREQRLELDIAADTPVIRGDQQRLTQVLVNLLANANKFGPPATAIRIAARADDGGLEFAVEDEGVGPEDPSDSGLFDRFRRSGGEHDPNESGLGLGLFIVRSIVARHGGTVRIERTPERRTRAVVRLPPEPRR
jgi:signal transduction histidine kinase/HAMP domain-containing protein